ncbi:alpha/beta hydrolase family protein, partial [Candidatus Margulisiibacteriota bacterium]
TIEWAQRGYAVLTIDLPGRGDQRWGSRSSGPDMDVPILLRTSPDPTYNYLVHAVAAARNGITFLTQRPEVDGRRIGMVGLSWGGVITLLTNGQDKRLKTAVNVFGAGYIPEGCTWQDRFDIMSKEELKRWYTYIDPSNFLKTQHAPILFITGTNDHCYYLPTFQKSFEEVTAEKKLLLIANLRHRFLPYMQRIVWNWLDNKLKGRGRFPKVALLPVFKRGQNKLIVPVAATASSYITNATLYYTEGEPSRWTKRVWKSLPAYEEEGIYYFAVPTKLIKPEVMFYVNVKDNHGSTVSTPIRSIFKVNVFRGEQTYALSSPIQKINIHEPPLQLLGLKNVPEMLQIFFSKKNRSYHIIFPEKRG